MTSRFYVGQSDYIDQLNAMDDMAITVAAIAAAGTIDYSVGAPLRALYYTTAATANWAMNFRSAAGTSLDSVMAVGQKVRVSFLATLGATPFYANAFTVDGAAVTPKWEGGTAPSSGTASSVEEYVFTLIKTAASTFTVLATRKVFK